MAIRQGKRWWQHPTVIVGAITALAAIAVAIVQVRGSKDTVYLDKLHPSELAEILDLQPPAVLQSNSLDSTEKRVYLELHTRRVTALREGKLALFHELSAQIHRMLYEHKDLMWARMDTAWLSPIQLNDGSQYLHLTRPQPPDSLGRSPR